jgi:hypothetical protein
MDAVRHQILTTLQGDWAPPIKGQAIDFDFEWDEFYTTYVNAPAGNDTRALKYYTQTERDSLIAAFCDRLFQAATEPNSCVDKLETIFSELVICSWRPPSQSVSQLSDEVEDYVQRLPQLPTELPGPLSNVRQGHFNRPTKTWASLRVVSHFHGNLVRFIAYRLITLGKKGFVDFVLQQALNHVGEFIQHCVHEATTTKSRADQATWYVVRAFLWSFWQRLRVLYSFFILIGNLRLGFTHGNEQYMWMRNFVVAPDLSLRALTEDAAIRQKSPNLCGWAFELLRGDPACLGLDFGILFRRFQDAYGQITPRCRDDMKSACDGRVWKNCRRFYRPDTENQTMHDQTQPHDIHNEDKITWNEDSYRSIRGARAVDICCATANCLLYCAASERTLAFSHVWSHGQGGRPETGVNRCLHRRYVELAKSLGCDSYWIDSACV